MEFVSIGFEAILNDANKYNYTECEKTKTLENNVFLYVDKWGSYRFVKKINSVSVSGLQIMKKDDFIQVANVFTLENHRQKGYAKELFLTAKKYFKKNQIKHSINLSELGKIFAQKVN